MSPKIYGIFLMLIMANITLAACTAYGIAPVSVTFTPGDRTGVAELDEIITIALGGNVAELRPLLEFTQTRCTFAEGLGGPPKCLDGEQEGTPVEVLPFLGPEGHFIRKADIGSWHGLDVSGVFAVYRVSNKAYTEENYPAGQYAIVFLGGPENKSSITLQVRRGRIIRIDYGANYPPEIPTDAVDHFLLPPIHTNP